MTPLGVWLTITVVITAGVFLGVFASWIGHPKWATSGRLAVILLVVAAADAGVTYLQQTAPVVASAAVQDSAAAASAAGLVPAGRVDPGQAERAIVAVTGENTGNSHLVESSLGGAANATLGPGPVGGPFAVTGNGDLVVAGTLDGKAHASGLEVISLSGKPLRLLTWPTVNTVDTDPAVTADGEVYFERTAYAWSGPDGMPVATQVMKVPLSRKTGPVRIAESVPLLYGSLSVDAAGTLLAGTCVLPGGDGASEACVLALPSGRVRYITHFNQSAPVIDVALSPDGRYLAYADGAANAYGTSQVYVDDLATGSVVMVSRLPGDSTQPSWIAGSAAPCLVYSDSQTSGDTVYLSCLSADPGTARIAAGDYPEWLGTTLPAAHSLPPFDWRGLWDRSRPAVLLAGMFVLGLLVGLFGGWFPRPAWATRVRLGSLIVVLGVLQVGGALVIPDLFAQSSGGLATVAQLDPSQAGGLLVAVVSTGGTGQLFGVRLNGTDVQPLQFYPGGSPFIPLDDIPSKFVYLYGGSTDAGIRVVGPTGNEIRILTDPTATQTDSAPALAAEAGQVFFVRSTVVPVGLSGSTTTVDPVVMRVSVTGGAVRRVPLVPAPVGGPISVDAAGTELAAACPDGHYVEACVYDLSDGRLLDKLSTPVGATNVALSPDGRYLAYSNGLSTVLYVHDFQTGQTVAVSTLPGWNDQPAWLQGGSNPCLLYVNSQTAADTIYLACLAPKLAWAPVMQGESPAWLGP